MIPQNLTLPIKIGTRGSPLALAQAYQTRDRIKSAFKLQEDDFEIIAISTKGDQIQDKPLREFGGKGLFTKEIENQLINGGIDIAVHSMKDVPTILPQGLVMAAILPREDVRDAFISIKYSALQELPIGAVVGSSSLRRAAILLAKRPDLKIVNFRGSVNTRLEKLANGDVDATILAVAGLNRLGINEVMTHAISAKDMLPAVAQGAIGLEVRDDDIPMIRLLSAINCGESQAEINMERAFLRALDGSCRTPIAALAQVFGQQIEFKGKILTPDGKIVHDAAITAPLNQAEVFGRNLGLELLEKAGPDFFEPLCEI
ncbi:MAG: hydroxymethylbilane synthase [Rhizobiales bacterium]|nr:hydroxymethylbilane synthase [Hyphomicrobiales bacterium]NRB15157.1 hydroxymethylbilane synthase [Hyphomicrobiales bacterium]